MARQHVTDRGSEHALLRSLRLDPWSAADLAALLGQMQLMAGFVRVLEAQYRSLWLQDLPISGALPPWPVDLEASIQACREALGVSGAPRPLTATTTLCEGWRQLSKGDPLYAFVVLALGAHWGEPALRLALREALWHQPDLYNGDTRFCWEAGGPEGETRRRVWQCVMSLGPGAARTARLARSTRLQWYDGLLSSREPPAARATGPLVLASM
jgi:hypothetical protein